MRRAPRPSNAPILDRPLIGRITIVGVLLLAGAFGLFEYAQHAGYDLLESRTIAANVFVFGQMAYLFNCRSLILPSWRSSLGTNRFLLGGVSLMIVLQLLYTYLPGMNRLFGTAPVPLASWGWVLGVALAVHLVVETEKWLRRRGERVRLSGRA